jgi:hypothetical protein
MEQNHQKMLAPSDYIRIRGANEHNLKNSIKLENKLYWI